MNDPLLDYGVVDNIDTGFDFLGFHTRRVTRNDGREVVLTYPSKASLEAVKHKIKQATGPNTASLRLVDVLWTVNPILRGWTAYHRHNAASRTFRYLGHYSWWRMIYWLRRKHGMSWKQLRRHYYGADRISQDGVVLYNPARMPIRRYRFRGAAIPTPYNVGLIQGHEPGSERWINDRDDTTGRVSELISDRKT